MYLVAGIARDGMETSLMSWYFDRVIVIEDEIVLIRE